MILAFYTVLKDEKCLSVEDLTALLRDCKTEMQFYKELSKHLASVESFKIRRADNGFNRSKYDIFKDLLKTYYSKEAAQGMNKYVKIKINDVMSNVEAMDKVYHELAMRFSESRVGPGLDIVKSIFEFTHDIYHNNKEYYQPAFRKNISIEHASGDYVDHSLVTKTFKEITDGLVALRNIPTEEVKAILHDIFETTGLYMLNSPDIMGAKYYSLYESFSRVYFNYMMSEFNNKYSNKVMVLLRPHTDNKLVKLDNILNQLLVTFIIPGISVNNIREFERVAFSAAENNKATNVAELYGITDITITRETSKNAAGNFGSHKTFKPSKNSSTEEASVKYTKFIKGVIALSKLYRYITDAGFSPLDIHHKTFEFKYGDPSEKYKTLDELILYSYQAVAVKDKYNLKTPSTQFKAVMSKNNTSLLVDKEASEVIIRNRNSIRVEDLSGYISSYLEIGNRESYSILYLNDTGYYFNLFNFIEYIRDGYNPLFTLYDGPHCSWLESIKDRYVDDLVDKPVSRDINSVLLECSDTKMEEYSKLYLDDEQIKGIIASGKGDIGLFFDDLTSYDMDKQIDILLAFKEFVVDFNRELEGYVKRYEASIISEIEYATYIYKHSMFIGLHDIVKADVLNQSADEEVIIAVAVELLKVYMPNLTYDDFKAFITRPIKHQSYDNFLSQMFNTTFPNIVKHFHSAKASLYNLSDMGKEIRLSAADLNDALQNIPEMSYEERELFVNTHSKYSQDTLGYYVLPNQDVAVVKNLNNKIGALHSMGVYVFNDGTTMPWNK